MRICCAEDSAAWRTPSHETDDPFILIFDLKQIVEATMQSIQSIGLQRAANPGPVQVIAVTGGKGGVGKTSVAVNLSTALASTGRRVMLLDGDLGLANVDVFLGLSPRYTMAHVLSGERTLEEIILDSPHGIQVVPGASGVAELANLSAAGHLKLVQGFSAIATRLDP